MIWILEERRIGEQEWKPCVGTSARASQYDFDPGLFRRESFDMYEFRARAYVPALLPPVNNNAPGPAEPPRPPRDRSVR